MRFRRSSTGQELLTPHFRPGDVYQPCYLDIPSRPRADFIWGCLGSAVISERVRQRFESLNLASVSYSPVTLRKVGKKEARLPAPIPSTGEPEDIIQQVPLLTRTDAISPFFELVIQSESKHAPAALPLSVCSACGRETFPKTDARFVMVDSMWNGADIFFRANTLDIVVTDRVRQTLHSLGATNVRFEPFEAA